jgi:hemolysin activation/secretion protein
MKSRIAALVLVLPMALGTAPPARADAVMNIVNFAQSFFDGPTQGGGASATPAPESKFECNLTRQPAPRVTLKEIVFEGLDASAVFTRRDFAPIEDCYRGQSVTIEDIGRLRDAVTRMYVARRMVSSGAIVVPGQDLSSGILRLRLIEGRVSSVEVSGCTAGAVATCRLTHIDPEYVVDRFAILPGQLVKLDDFEERFRVLLDDPAIAQVNANLLPGDKPG